MSRAASPAPDPGLDRRTFLGGAGALAAGAAASAQGAGEDAGASAEAPAAEEAAPARLDLKLACSYYMVAGDMPMVERFRLLKRVGFDGVELDSPNGFDKAEVLRARDESGLRIHGVVDSTHWKVHISSPDPAVRAQAVQDLRTAIQDCHDYGGEAVLLVPGVANDDQEDENQEKVWERSIPAIRQALPLAADLGVKVLIENVWNHFCYVHDGPRDQTAYMLAAYIDAIGSPWVGSYYDLGNHRRYGRPEGWLRTLGPRVTKLHVKDWSFEKSWCPIGDGSIDWPAVCESLRAIRYTGWANAEVSAGDEAHLEDVLARMRRVLELA